MPRSLSPEREAELDALRRLQLALADFFAPELDAEAAAELREATERAYGGRSLAGLRAMRDESVAMVEACVREPARQRQLDTLLRERAGTSLDALLTRRRAGIAKIREQGRIATDAQYYLVREYVELIWQDPERAEEFAALQGLLDAYEQRAARRGQRGRADRDRVV